MSKPTCLTLKVVVLLLAGSYFSGCTGGAASSSFGSGSSATVGAPPTGISNGVTDPNFFYVGINMETNSAAHVHKENEFSQSCSIDPKTSVPLQNISCIIDIPEGELFHQGLDMVFNVPPGMCTTLRRKTYWFYNYPVGYGPRNIRIYRHYIDGTLESDYTCTVDGITTPTGTCGPFKEVSIDVAKGIPTCKYVTQDSANPLIKRNGCLGEYHLVITDRKDNTDNGATSTVDTVNDDFTWGGNVAEVIGGAARLTGWEKTAQGIPVFLDSPASKGLSQNYFIPAPIVMNDEPIGSTTNLEIANYFTPATHIHTGFVLTRSTNLPYFIDPVDDLDGSLISPSQPTYDFECLDQADEVIHRIGVSVREWDTYKDFENYISSNGQTEIPDRSGVEGPDCTGLVGFGTCNDMWDADDLVTLILKAPYDLTGTGEAKRPSYFPRIRTK